MAGICDIQTPKCSAREASAITAVWTSPGRSQVNICRNCMEEMIRTGKWEVPGSRIPMRADVAVTGPDHRLILVVEVRIRPFYDRKLDALAERIHRNLLLHRAVPGRPFFMLLFVPRPAFLWKPESFGDPGSPPDFRIELTEEAENLFGETDKCHPEDEHTVMEETVAKWLTASIADINNGEKEIPEWLANSGLASHIRNARVFTGYRLS